MTPTPTDARALLAYLEAHPHVTCSCADPRIVTGERWFSRHRTGGLWFRDARGAEHYVPVDCGMTAAETGLTFRPDGFDVTKFGIVVHFEYLD